MSLPILVCPYSRRLLQSFTNQTLAVRVKDITTITEVVEQVLLSENRLACIIIDTDSSMTDCIFGNCNGSCPAGNIVACIVINGVSKQYAMTGFRIGWAIANKKIIEAMTNIQGHQTSGPSVLLQKAAIGAINGIQSSVEALRGTLENNRNVMMD